jgi:hypothetical protein
LVSFSSLKRLEGATIQAIKTLAPFGRLNSLQSAAHQASVASAHAMIDLNLGFTLPTRLREDTGNRAIERNFQVGCLAHAADDGDSVSQLTYSVLIGEHASPELKVARKFHFDFEPAATRNLAESKPTYHLQLCGKLSSHHRNSGYVDEHINHLLPSWSQPRIPVQPTSLALVLNWLFIEFGSEPSVANVRTNPRWRSLVRQAEREILKPYYEACTNFLSATANEDESFFSKRLYEEH